MTKIAIAVVVITSLLSACTDESKLSAPPAEGIAEIKTYIQTAIAFAQHNEVIALEKGIRLTLSEQNIANKIGIKDVDKIRILYVDKFPFPEDEKLAEFARTTGLDSPFVEGFTYGYAIYIKNGAYSRELIAHELIHVQQYEKLGIEKFMSRYLIELAMMGYRNAPLEVEAYERASIYK